jgi:hypothetical protein
MGSRMNRHQFFAKVEGVDADRLRKILWSLYYPGSSQMRQRIEDALDPPEKGRKEDGGVEPDASFLREEVEEFCRLSRSGAYMGGSREVSPSERRKWRHTFRRLADEALRGLGPGGFDDAAPALEQLIDLICEAADVHYFHSDDPVQAANLVVSTTVGALWKASLEHEGFPAFARRAAPQLLRWERAFGWTRYGDGSVAERETPLAAVVGGLLKLPDTWVTFADSYLGALDTAAEAARLEEKTRDGYRRDGGSWAREERARRLERWHGHLLDRLAESDAQDRLDRLVHHPGLEGPEKTFLQARLAHRRGDLERSRTLATRCLESLPGHAGFLAFAQSIGARIPASARRVQE